MTEATTLYAKWTETPGPATTYYVWVGGVRVTSVNAGNVLGDGTVSYTPAMGAAPQTLTLNGANITGVHEVPDVMGGDVDQYGIFADETLSLVLQGDNMVTAPAYDGGSSFAIGVNQDLAISGLGTLNAAGGDVTAFGGTSCGLFAEGRIKIENCTVTASGGASKHTSDGIEFAGGITIKDSTVITSGNSSEVVSRGIYGMGMINIENSTLTATGGTADYYSHAIYGEASATITIDNSTVTATGGTTTTLYSGNSSYGLFTNRKDITIKGNSVVTATGGTLPAGDSYGITSSIYSAAPMLVLEGQPTIVAQGESGAVTFPVDTAGYTPGTATIRGGPDAGTTAVIPAVGSQEYVEIGRGAAVIYNPGSGAVTGDTVEDKGIIGLGYKISGAVFNRDGYTQTGWATADGGAKVYDFGEIHTISAPVGLYPVWTEIAPGAYTITATAGAGGSISPSGNVSVDSGGLQTFTITPAGNYSISDVKVDGTSIGAAASYTFNHVDANHTISATFTYNGGGSGGGGSSHDDDRSSVIVTLPAPDDSDSPTQGEIGVAGSMDGQGNVTVSISGRIVTDAFDMALAEARENGLERQGVAVVLRVDTGMTGSHVTVNLPKSVQDIIISKGISSIIVVAESPGIRIGMDLATVREINRQANSDVNITAAPMDSGALGQEAQNAIGSRPVFGLIVNYGNGRQVQDFGEGSVSVTIPYTLGENETAENICAVYVDGNGNVHWLTDSVYDSEERVLRFCTGHFSAYGVGYKKDASDFAYFTDIDGHWAKEDIEFVANRGLFSGTSATTFSPNTAMTRGMFVTVLGRLADADVSGYTKSSFADVTNDAYYMGYIQWAGEKGIVCGIDDYSFAPDECITREQMAVIMTGYAKAVGHILPEVHGENIFADSGEISAYARDAVKQMQMAGVISGKNDNLFDPQGAATRAEVSAVLRRFAKLEIPR